MVSELRTASPSVARLADLAVWREREAFEEKTKRALSLLRKKDTKIRELGEAVARRKKPSDGKSAAAGRPDALDRGGGGGHESRGEGPSVVKRMEERVEDQAEQIEALLEEVSGVPLSVFSLLK